MQYVIMLKLKRCRCVWAVINITLVDTTIHYNVRMVQIMAEICRRHTAFVTITNLYTLMYIR